MEHPLWCYAISAKRYVLYRKDEGKRVLVDVLDGPEVGESTEIGDEEQDPKETVGHLTRNRGEPGSDQTDRSSRRRRLCPSR